VDVALGGYRWVANAGAVPVNSKAKIIELVGRVPGLCKLESDLTSRARVESIDNTRVLPD